MKNIIKIFRDDFKDIFSNSAVMIILIGLAILPSLYAWFNIKACVKEKMELFGSINQA